MSVIAHGIDLVECVRIARIHEHHRQRFLDRVLISITHTEHTAAASAMGLDD